MLSVGAIGIRTWRSGIERFLFGERKSEGLFMQAFPERLIRHGELWLLLVRFYIAVAEREIEKIRIEFMEALGRRIETEETCDTDIFRARRGQHTVVIDNHARPAG